MEKTQYSMNKAYEERENTTKEFEKMLEKYDRYIYIYNTVYIRYISPWEKKKYCVWFCNGASRHYE